MLVSVGSESLHFHFSDNLMLCQSISIHKGSLTQMQSGQAEINNIDKQLVYQCRCSFLEVNVTNPI